jgi:hypothetical protein
MKQPKAPYRTWFYEPSKTEPGLFDVFCREPDGTVMKMRIGTDEASAKAQAEGWTETECQAQLEREAMV